MLWSYFGRTHLLFPATSRTGNAAYDVEFIEKVRDGFRAEKGTYLFILEAPPHMEHGSFDALTAISTKRLEEKLFNLIKTQTLRSPNKHSLE